MRRFTSTLNEMKVESFGINGQEKKNGGPTHTSASVLPQGTIKKF